MSNTRIGDGIELLLDVERCLSRSVDMKGLSKQAHDKLIFCERYKVLHQSMIPTDADIEAIREWERARGFCCEAGGTKCPPSTKRGDMTWK